MPIRLQGRLLRVLQEKEMMRLGSDKVTRVSVRVIAATNKDLLSLVDAGTFREDLYYRLAVLNLCLPSLDERREDIPVLVRHFLNQNSAGSTGRPPEIEPRAMALLRGLSWPGNIRELRNACEQLAVLGGNRLIDAEGVERFAAEKTARMRRRSPENPTSSPVHPPLARDMVMALLAEGHTRQKIAEQFGISRSTLWRIMRGWKMSQ